jgi:serine protease Do
VTPALTPFRLPLLALPLLALALAEPARGEDFLDDAAIKASFEDGLTRLFQQGGLPTGSTTAGQLREALRARPHPLPASPRIDPEIAPPTDDFVLSSAFAHAKAATLVLGHLYLCGKCDRYHGNLAGGVLVSPDGLALTNYHVLDFREAIVFGAMTAAGEVYAIDEVLAASESDDVALVRLRGAKDLPHLALQTGLKTGEELFVVSHPDGHFYTLTRGYLARRYLTAKERAPRLQITADFAKGSSGCGILNLRGELVGLVTSTSSIYYNESEGKKDNLQMVVKSGVPAESITKLFQAPATAPPVARDPSSPQ